MCHGNVSSYFPEPGEFRQLQTEIQGAVYGSGESETKIAILPDIYGSNPFYQGLATRLASKNAQVILVDVFAGLGDLPQATREAAFERRHQLRDQQFVDTFAGFVKSERINGVVGFCLGGLFIFELARRNIEADLVGFYPFPQGLPNQDPLDVPFDYLHDVTRHHTILVGTDDASLGEENLARLRSVAQHNDALDLHTFESSGHGFLSDLDSDDSVASDNAKRALAVCESVLGLDGAD